MIEVIIAQVGYLWTTEIRRMEQIKKITGMDYMSFDTMLHIMLSFRMLDAELMTRDIERDKR